MQLLITGGEQRRPRGLTAGQGRWYKYKKAHLISVDTETGSVDSLLEYETPSDAAADEEPAILFKQGMVHDDELLLTTQTEVLILEYPTLARKGYISLPSFHDVHHVVPTRNDTLLVVNTGLDQLIEVTRDGDVKQRWSVISDDPWSGRFSPDVDYRKVPTTKPYEAHPNHVFHIGDEIWVTRFDKRDAISIDDPTRRIEIGVERVHDGLVRDGLVYFTAVNGQIAIADTSTLEIVEIVDLNEVEGDGSGLGWCRGLCFEGDTLWVGFSRLRPTAIRQNVAWVKDGFKRSHGTHIARYDLRRRSLEERIPLEESSPLNAVFSILPA